MHPPGVRRRRVREPPGPTKPTYTFVPTKRGDSVLGDPRVVVIVRNRESDHGRQRRVKLGLSPETFKALQAAAEAEDRSLSYLAD